MTIRCQYPCCGYYTLNSRNMNDICPVCYWENEFIEDPNEFDDCNGISLNEARKNYIRFGYSKKRDKLWVRKPRKKEMFCNRYIHEYINLLGLYTNIDITKKDITKEVKKVIKGKFNDLYDCAPYLNYSKEYAIRFNDDMKAEEFDNVFETLIKDLGEPDLFNEWEGYIWKRRGYVIALGLVSLNYNYEVPMICVKRRTSIFNSNLDYKNYIEIANSIRDPLINRGVNPQRMTLVYQKRKYGTVSHTYKCTTYMRNKDYCPRPNTLLHRQIKSIVEQELRDLTKNINREEFLTKLLERKKKESSNIDIESKISKLEMRKDKLYQLTKKVYDDALNEIIDSETSSKMIKEYQEEQKKISSEIETLKNLKQEEESTIENYKLLKEKVNEFLEFKELNSLIVHKVIYNFW